MAKEIGTEWIQIALENGAWIKVERFCGVIMAFARWPNGACVAGKACGNVSDALDSLDTELAEDASTEMMESVVV